MKETDLYMPIYKYLTSQGYTVRSEVMGCDITAIRGEDLVVVEMKQSFNVTLLLQAAERQRMTDSVYVALPRPAGGKRGKSWHGMCHLLRRLELGLMLVAPAEKSGGEVEIIFHPGVFDRSASMNRGKKKKISVIREINARYGDFNVGGSVRQKLVTAYRETAIHMACCMEKLGPCSPAQLKKLGTGKKTQSILTKNFYGWFEKVAKGRYDLTPEGRSCLVQYAELAHHYRIKVEESISKHNIT